MRVRAHFEYDPDNDPYIPCKEAGLGFKRGEVLHIVSQDDSYWWQARKECERTVRAGLIPSRALQERRVIHERKQINGEAEGKSKSSTFFFIHPQRNPLTSIFSPLSLISPEIYHRQSLRFTRCQKVLVLQCAIPRPDLRWWAVHAVDPKLKRSCMT